MYYLTHRVDSQLRNIWVERKRIEPDLVRKKVWTVAGYTQHLHSNSTSDLVL
jgi:hypothetical protein